MNNKIKYVSIFFKILFQISFFGLIIFQILSWSYSPQLVIPKFYLIHSQQFFDINTKIAGFFVSIFPTLIKLFILYFLIKLFQLYERMEFFSQNNVRYIRNAGYALLILQFVNPFSEFLLGFILTWQNPPGLRFARFTISEWSIGLILTSLIIILISWIMKEGCKLHDEQQLTI